MVRRKISSLPNAPGPTFKRHRLLLDWRCCQKIKISGKIVGTIFFRMPPPNGLDSRAIAKIKSHQLKSPTNLPTRKLGGWTLENEETMWLSPETNSPFPLGELNFKKTNQLLRAYLKLWEFFRSNIKPQEKEICLNIGSFGDGPGFA